jgi:DNA-binding transcriptional LysR family regulator
MEGDLYPTERLKGIESFVLSAQMGSFTAAAEKLNLTNSAVGKSVGRLEMRLGRKLFERTTRSLTLTDAGSAFLLICTRVLGELADAEAVLAAQENEPAGRLRINAPLAFGHIHLMPLVLKLAARHPGLRPEVTFTDRFVDIAEENVDIAIRISSTDAWPDTLGRRLIGSERLVFCASPEFLDRCGSPRTLAELVEFDAVLYGRPDGTVMPWRLAHDASGIESRTMSGRMAMGSAEAQVAAVKAGFGIAQLATWLIQEELASGKLVEILPEYATEGLRLHIVWLRSRQLSPRVDAAIGLLSEELRI